MSELFAVNLRNKGQNWDEIQGQWFRWAENGIAYGNFWMTIKNFALQIGMMYMWRIITKLIYFKDNGWNLLIGYRRRITT